MKKFFIIICIICSIIAGTVALVLSLPKSDSQKFSQDFLKFQVVDNPTGTFYSNYKSSPTSSFEDYTIIISAENGENIKSPNLTHSANIQVIMQQNLGTSISIKFCILGGDSFSFTLDSENFESITKAYTSIEYTQKANIKLKISLDGGLTFEDYQNGVNNIIYFVEPSQMQNAEQDGYKTSLVFKAVDTNNPDKQFIFTTSASGCLKIINGELGYVSVGSSYLTATASDGSGASKAFLFFVKYVSPTSIEGLPSEIEIDFSHTNSYLLPSHTVKPEYADGYTISYKSGNSDLFTIKGHTITALSPGETQLIVLVNEIAFMQIPVTIKESPLPPAFTFKINSTSQKLFGQHLTLSDNLLTLTTKNITSSYITIVIDVGITSFESGLNNITVSYQDPNGIIFSTAGEPTFGIGTETYIPCTIYLLKKTGTVNLTFSKTINNTEITKNLVITLT